MNLDPTKDRIPVRVQRRRTKGWKAPYQTINCARKGKYGNPFKIVGDMVFGDASHRRKLLSPWVYLCLTSEADPIELHKEWLLGTSRFGDRIIPRPFTIDELKAELAGHNLMCFCKLSDPCHVDFLLEVANS